MRAHEERPLPKSLVDDLDRAGRGLEEVCATLLRPSPAALDECAERCQRAAAELAACLPRIQSARGRPEAVAAAQRLAAAVRSARRLLESAASYHRRWQAMLGAMSGGYTSDGDPAPLIRTERLILRA